MGEIVVEKRGLEQSGSQMRIEQLTQENAETIADTWKYPGIYAFYDMTADPEDYKEIITPELRGDHYFQVVDDGELFGFFSLEEDEDGVELGLGIKPELTGCGRGEAFVRLILDFIVEGSGQGPVRLAVAEFNERAITVYRRLGFVETRRYEQKTNSSVHRFVEMEKRITQTHK